MKQFRERITKKQAEDFGLINQNLRLQQKMQKQKTIFSNFNKGESEMKVSQSNRYLAEKLIGINNRQSVNFY
jgi:hypothetical protein